MVIRRTGSPARSSTRPSALKTAGSGAFGITTGSRELQPQLAVLLEAVSGLEDRRVRELAVELEDALVGAVVEAAVDADRAVHAMHHPATRTG